MQKIAIGIVLYNPDNINRLIESLDSLIRQKRKIYVYDNSSKKIEINLNKEIIYLTENKNVGIAHALNCLMQAAKDDGNEWLITMDQDSILPGDAISEYEKYINSNKIGIICPQVIDKRRAYMTLKSEPKTEYVDFCITSGSCTSIRAWEDVGKFDDYLFIDLVDNEFCKRLVTSGYKILRINDIILNQEFGKIKVKSFAIQKFWVFIAKILKNENFGKLSYKKFVSPLRVYYTNRNIIYVNRKLKYYGPVGYRNYNCKSYIGFILFFNIPSILRAQNKLKVIKAIYRGTLDGLGSNPKIWKSDCDKG